MCPAFPDSDYYRGSAPSGHEPTAGLPILRPGWQKGLGGPDGSRVHHAPVDGGGDQLSPSSIATSTPQAFLVASCPARVSRASESPLRACAATRPMSTRFGDRWKPCGALVLVSLVHLPVLLAGPRSSGSADPSRRCQGCSHPPLRSQGQAALSFTGLLRQVLRRSPFIPARLHGASWRTPWCFQHWGSWPPRNCLTLRKVSSMDHRPA